MGQAASNVTSSNSNGPERRRLAQNLPPEQQQRGEMVKLGHLVKNWKKRFFVLRLELGGPQGDTKSFHLLYYETEEGCDTEGTRPKGDIDLTGATVTGEAGPVTSSSWPAFQFPFRVTTRSNKPYRLRVSGQGEREQWLDALTQAIELNEFLRRPMEFFAASCKSVAQLEAKLATITGCGGVPVEDKELAAATVERIKREGSLPLRSYEELATFIGQDVAKQLEDKFSACTCISRRQLQEELTKVQASDKFSPEAKDFAVEVTEKIQAKKQLPHYRNPYEDYASLNAATDGDVDGAPAVLVRLSWLLELLASGGRISARQQLPREAIFTGRITDDVLVIALSYCWCTKAHPDPEGLVLADLCVFLRYLDASRYWGDDDPNVRQLNIHDRQVVVFWDYMAFYQNLEPWPASGKKEDHGDSRTPEQYESFKRGLGSVNLFYAHAKTLVVLATEAHRTLKYNDSGWPFFEFSISLLPGKPTNGAIFLPEANRWIEEKCGLQLEKVPAMGETQKNNASYYWLLESNRRGERILPLTPEAFAPQVRQKTVTNGADTELLVVKYRETYEAVVRPTTRFELSNMASSATPAHWRRFLREVLPRCVDLVHVDLSRNEAIGGDLEDGESGEGCVGGASERGREGGSKACAPPLAPCA